MKVFSSLIKACILILIALSTQQCSINNTDTAGGAGGTEVPNGIAGIIEDESGTPLSGIAVTLRSDQYTNPTVTAKTTSHTPLIDTTDEVGSFHFVVSDTGTFVIEAYTKNNTATRFSFTKSDTLPINLGTNATITNGSLTGEIIYPDTLNGAVLLNLLGSPHSIQLDSTTSTFSFSNIPAGEYSISVTGLSPLRAPRITQNITVYSDSTHSEITLPTNNAIVSVDTTATDTLNVDTTQADTTPSTGSITGTITGINTPNDTVYVQLIETGETITTDLNGAFSFSTLSAGVYNIRSWSSSLHRDTSVTLTVNITSDSHSSGHTLILPIKVLIVDGVNFHDWETISVKTTTILENSGLFSVSRSTSPNAQAETSMWNQWSPSFKEYSTVIINYDSPNNWYNHSHIWPDHVKTRFENYLRNNGNVVILHSGRNSNGGWSVYDEILGLGFYINGEHPTFIINEDKTVAIAPIGEGHHTFSTEGEALIEQYTASHSITKNLPLKWLHSYDIIDGGFTGPANNTTILNTVWNDSTQTRIPFDWTVQYESSRIYNANYGHIVTEDLPSNTSMSCLGLQTLLIRGTEWAATGTVNYAVPNNFPTEFSTSTEQ